MAKGRNRVTIADIAREAGYSKTAVSFAFNGSGRISEEAKEKILSTARDLNYVPDPTARNLSLGRRLTIGFLFPQETEVCLANPYIVEVLRGIGKVTQEHGYMLTLIPPLSGSVYEAVKNASVDGLITMGYMLREGLEQLLNVRSMSLVMIDGGECENYLSVNIDDRGAAKLQLMEVLKRGHRKISILSLPAPMLAMQTDDRGLIGRRLSGYRDAMEEMGADPSLLTFFQCEATADSGYSCAKEILKAEPTCIVTMSDIQAYGILRYFAEVGIRVPEDISLVGFDSLTSYPSYNLATISQPGYEKGCEAARTLFRLLEGEEVSSAPSIPYSFIEGRTLRAIKEN